MTENIDCLPVIQGFFFVTTLALLLFSFFLMKKIGDMRKKISSMIETIAEKNKALEEKKSSPKSLLRPFDSETSKSIIISIDISGKITYVNENAEEIFGYTKDEMIGHDVFGTIFPIPTKKDSLQANIISRIFTNPKLYVEHETENIKKNGEHFWISWTNRVIYDDKGSPLEVRSVGFDITKRKKLEEELRAISNIDPVTGVLNRQAFLEGGAHELKRSNRYNRQLSILIMKLNYYHDTAVSENQTFSDTILKETVQVCRSSVRDSDLLGRIGDIEFGIVLPETPSENAVFLAERLKQKIQEKNLTDASGYFVTATFGVAGKESKDDTIDSLLLRAFNALKQADQNAKARVVRKKKGPAHE